MQKLTKLILVLGLLVCLLLPATGWSSHFCDDCVGTHVYPDGGRYVGGWKDGRFHGQGTATFANGNKYVGEWKAGEQHGQGTFTFANGNKYVGGWKDAKQHGQGTFTWANGDKYVGEHKDGKPNGQGTFTWANGDKYVGESKDGKQHGQGTETYVNGNKYVGEYKNGKLHGQGTQTWASGGKYVGEFKLGKRHGQGTLTWPNGDKYVGEFKDGKRHGQGVLKNSYGGVEKKGVWKDGVYQSKYAQKKPPSTPRRKGRVEPSKGYPSSWICSDRLRYCFGDATYYNGDKYQGEWRYGKRHGIGTYKRADGTVLEGVWKNGAYQSKFAQKKPSRTLRRKGRVEPSKRTPKPDEKLTPESSGTGFAVTSRGHIITNHHVIKGCGKIRLHHKGKTIATTTINVDAINDLALLKASFKPAAVFSISKKNPKQMEEIFAAGFPFGWIYSKGVKVTKGIVSSEKGLGNNSNHFQMDAAVQPGNSGGPVLDRKGNVVGIAVGRVTKTKKGKTAENTSFAIKSSVLRTFLEHEDEIKLNKPSAKLVSTTRIGKTVRNATYFLSCWMTTAQRKKARNSGKVLFRDLK